MKTFFIGRNPNNHLVLSNGIISGQHAEISVQNDGSLVLTDHSTNGTYVNNQLLHQNSCSVNYGDTVIFPDGTQLDWNLIINFFGQQTNNFSQGNPLSFEQEIPSHGNQNNNGQANSSNSPARKISFGETFSDAFKYTFTLFPSVLGTVLLYLLTIWIPYINVGTSIAILTLPMKIAKGENFSPIYIFQSEYRKLMGSFLLLFAMVLFCSIFAFSAVIIPTVVLLLSWSMALYFMIDRNLTPIEALKHSNEATYGSKVTMLVTGLLVYLIWGVILGLIVGIFALIITTSGISLFDNAGGFIALYIVFGIVAFCGIVLYSCSVLSLQASIWRQLKDN